MAARNHSRSIQLWGLALIVLLALVGWLQYRWIGALSQADRERAIRGIERAAAGFTRDFDRMLSRVALGLLPATGTSMDDTEIAERHRQWRRVAAYPELVRGLFVRDVGSTEPWRQLNLAEGGGWEPTSLPAGLRVLEGRLPSSLLRGPFGLSRRDAAGRRSGPDRAGPRGSSPSLEGPFVGSIPALILPFRGERRGRLSARVRPRVLIVWLDRATLVDRVLPDLVARYFTTTTDEPFRLAVVDRLDTATVLYRAGLPVGQDVPRSSAVAMDFGGLLTLAMLGETEVARWTGELSGEGEESRRGRRARPLLYEGVSRASEARWTLLAEHPGGSVDEAVQRARWRNIGLSLGVLGVLAAALALQWNATRRLQRVARQQLDFVAGVTHELRTPVAAMRVAGQNLAEGVVRDPDKVRRYGTLVEREGQRLTVMIEQVLAFAGIQAGKRAYRRDRVDVRDVIDGALAEMKPALDEVGMVAHLEVADDLPAVHGDATALTQALRNLIENAVKYAADGGRVDVAVSVPAARAGEPMVEIVVSDRGPGIATRDLDRIFEPFVRGDEEDGGTHHVGGSGLGLSLVRDIVEGHAGTVSVASNRNAGSTFTLRLPAESEQESA